MFLLADGGKGGHQFRNGRAYGYHGDAYDSFRNTQQLSQGCASEYHKAGAYQDSGCTKEEAQHISDNVSSGGIHVFSGFSGVLPVPPSGREIAVYEDEKENHQQDGGRSRQESILTAPPDDGSRKDKEEALHQIVAAADSDVHKEKGNAQNEPGVGNYRTNRIACSQFSGSLHSSHN